MTTIKNKPDQGGAVALITAMIVSILMIITASSMVALTVKSVRQASDGGQSLKAYYAAEGGLEEAIRSIRTNGTLTANCTGGTSAGSAADGVVTCVRSTQSLNQVSDELQKEDVVQLDLTSISGWVTAKVEWSNGADHNVLSKIPDYSNGFPGTPSGGGTGNAQPWDAGAPAVMELNTIQMPTTASFAISSVTNYEAIIAPKSNQANNPSYAMVGSGILQKPSGILPYNGSDNPSTLAYSVPCDAALDYKCVAYVGSYNSTSNRFILRLKARYNSTHYRVTLLAADGTTVVPIPANSYVIDVTARAGDQFRRLQTTFTGAPTSAKGLDYVLYSDTNICKSFEIKLDPVDSQNKAYTLDPLCPTP